MKHVSLFVKYTLIYKFNFTFQRSFIFVFYNLFVVYFITFLKKIYKTNISINIFIVTVINFSSHFSIVNYIFLSYSIIVFVFPVILNITHYKETAHEKTFHHPFG